MLNVLSAFDALFVTRDTGEKIEIELDATICGSVTVRERFRKKKKE